MEVETRPSRLDQESLAIGLCIEGLESLAPAQTMRVLTYIGSRYIERLKLARQELDAKIKIIKQHAAREACEMCRKLEGSKIGELTQSQTPGIAETGVEN
jgi:hypothetical protein